MSQAQPRPPRRRRRRPSASASSRQRPGAEVTELRERREARKPPQRSRTGGLGRRPLIPFVLGAALGYGLAGPVPHWVSGALAGLLQNPSKLVEIVNPLGLGDRQVLVLGVDTVGDNTDVMLTVQVKEGATHLTQVPRDTFVESEGLGVTKANALYALGGAEAAKREVAQLVKGPVERYLKVNLRAVERLADAIGGVEVEVPKRMYYVDNSQGLYIDLYPGRQLLKGEALEGFLRFRNDALGDLGRMERQKLVLQEVFRKLVQPSTLAQLPALLKIAGDDIKTDLTPVEMGQLLTAMAGSSLNTAQLPGRVFWHNDLSYWMPESNSEYAGVESNDPMP